DGVHPAPEAVGDDLERDERAVDRRPARDSLEWSLERRVPPLPGIEGAYGDGDSREYSRGKGPKCRLIVGTSAIAPNWPASPKGPRRRTSAPSGSSLHTSTSLPTRSPNTKCGSTWSTSRNSAGILPAH